MQSAAKPKLGGRYTLSERIAVGGMGEVWKAHDDVLGRTVAIKILGQQFLESREFAERFRAEARHSASLAHPGVAGVFDYSEDGEQAFLVMEFVPGEAMSALLARTPTPPLATTLSILAQTADALAAAHAAGIIHRDVKPGNIIITPDGVAKVTDFGIARAADAMPLTVSGQVVGTPQYMSPEQASGLPVGPASDIYSLGVVLYEALGGRRPFVEATPLALAMAHVHSSPPPLPDSVPPDVRAVVERALAKDPDDRPADAAAFAAELRALQVRFMPPPAVAAAASAVAAGAGPTEAFTIVGDAGQSTQHMPAGGVAVAAPALVIDNGAVAPVRRSRAAPLIAAAVVLFVVAMLVVMSRRDAKTPLDVAGAETTLVTAGPISTPVDEAAVVGEVAPAATTFVDPAVYLDKPVADARKVLEALGFVVVEQPAAEQGGDLVVDIQPSGDVPSGSTITLTVGGVPNDDDDKPNRGEGKGNKDKDNDD